MAKCGPNKPCGGGMKLGLFNPFFTGNYANPYSFSGSEALPDLTSATVENDTPDVLDLVFRSAVNINTTGWTVVTDGANAVTVSSVLSGDGTTSPKLQLSRDILFDETLYVAYAPGTTEFTNGTALDALSEPVTRNVSLMFNGISQYGSFGDILDSLWAAADTNFWISLDLDKISVGVARRFLIKYDIANSIGFLFFINTSGNPIFSYATDVSNRRTVTSTGVVTDGDTLTLKYDGAIDTNNGLDRVIFEINGVATGKTLTLNTGTLPANIPNIAHYLGFGDALTAAGVNNGAAMFKGDVSNLVVRSNAGATVEINIPDLETGLDTSGNNRHMTRMVRVPPFSTYALRSNRNIIPEFTGVMDWHGRPRVVDVGNTWDMLFIEGDEHGGDGSQTLEFAKSANKGMPWLPKNTFTDGSAISNIPYGGGEGFSFNNVNLILCPNGDRVAIVQKMLPDATFQGHMQSRSTDGGKTWSTWVDISSSFEGDITEQWACFDYTVDDNDHIYIAISAHEGDLTLSAKSMAYKSTDNCATWTKVSDITDYADITWEAGIEWIGGTTFLSVIRTSALNNSGAMVRISTDSCATWSPLTNITTGAGGLHQPCVKKFDNEARIYVSGRLYADSNNQRNAFLYSDNNGTSWTLVNFTAVATTDDGGYGVLNKREDNIYILTAYSGELGVDGNLREYVIIGS